MVEQLELIDPPENVKPLIAKARQYRGTIAKRQKVQVTEAAEKEELRELVANSGLEPLENGNILFIYEDVTIEVEPEKPGKLTVTIASEKD